MFHIDGWHVVLPCPHGLRRIEVKFHLHSLKSIASDTLKKLYGKENLTGSILQCRDILWCLFARKRQASSPHLWAM